MKQRGSGKSGILAREDRKTSQGYVDLKKLNETELVELVKRQEKLLSNKSFITKLPDKGSKIVSFKAEIESEIRKRRQELDRTCDLLASLNINGLKPEDIEWNVGNAPESKKDAGDSDDDSDDDVDPLKLIATHSGTRPTGDRKRVVKAEEPSLITEDDLREIQELTYEIRLCKKFGEVQPIKERFKPNQLKDNDKNKFATSAANVKKKLGDRWEVTEATPPVPTYKDAKMISLSESLKLQKEQAEKLKEIERQNAAQRLLLNMNVKMGDALPTRNITEYRSPRDIFEETANESEEENVDDEKGGVVFYNIIDDAPGST